MTIEVDKDGHSAILSLCDVALKAGGMDNLKAITTIIASIKQTEEKK